MAKKQFIQYFTVGESEYTEIGDDLFLVLGRWGGHIMLIYNEKSKPKWGETNVAPGEVIKGGNGFYFIDLKTPKRTFLGMNTVGTFLQFYLWLFNEHKIEIPIATLTKIAEEESAIINAKPRKYKHLPLLSEVCKHSWRIQTGKDATDPKNYYVTKSTYSLHTPAGELSKDNPREHLLLEMLVPQEDLPPAVLIEDKLNKWKAAF